MKKKVLVEPESRSASSTWIHERILPEQRSIGGTLAIGQQSRCLESKDKKSTLESKNCNWSFHGMLS